MPISFEIFKKSTDVPQRVTKKKMIKIESDNELFKFYLFFFNEEIKELPMSSITKKKYFVKMVDLFLP